MASYFITGIGTGIGKTLIAAILTEALQADYWKPVQAGFEEGTDTNTIRNLISNKKSIIHPETYLLKLAASPHIAAAKENIEISLMNIRDKQPVTNNDLIIEGAGGLMVPLNKNEFVLNLIKELKASVIIVSKNYLGSINHSLLTAEILKQNSVKVSGWIFNNEYLNYEADIVQWSGFPRIASVGHINEVNKQSVYSEALKLKERLKKFI